MPPPTLHEQQGEKAPLASCASEKACDSLRVGSFQVKGSAGAAWWVGTDHD